MARKYGFIGAGNMGEAIIGGIIRSGEIAPADIIASDLDSGRLRKLADDYGINVTFTNTQVAEDADILFICVKPHVYFSVIDEIRGAVKPGAIIVSIAAGISLAAVAGRFGMDTKVARAMPNTPSLVNQGMAAICTTANMTTEDIGLVLQIFGSIGQARVIPENLFDAFIGVAGSAPAYVFVFIEALADAGVKYGLPRHLAQQFSAQAVLGAAEMVLKTGMHPGALKDQVCSPGGTTIEAVCELARQGFSGAVIDAVSACVEKSQKMGKNII
ncbi:MAG: pyrroline-5-carboxylate reductase [Defluviitaleaceae bacterium]|nr:pyrroline-5-carboxylate reductase [Defluviitaleaceae bacterium]